VDVKQVSRELGVRYVVEGSVRKAGDQVRVSAQLIDAPTGTHVWAERYDRELRDIFAVQDEITEVIVGSVAPELERSERDRAVRKEPQNLDAWDSIQRGWWHAWQITKDDNEKSRSFFERAIELDPHSSDAFSGLAWTHLFALTYRWTDSPAQSAAELSRTARRSVELDSSNALGQLVLSATYSLTGQLDEGIGAAERAVDLNPSSSLAYAFLAGSLAMANRPDEALTILEKAIRLSPRGPAMFLSLWANAVVHFVAQRYEEAVEWARRSLRANPKWLFSHNLLASAYAQLGRANDAQTALEEVLRLAPEFSISAARQNLAAADPAYRDPMIEGLRKAGLKE
jgi:adenylate cyclase